MTEAGADNRAMRSKMIDVLVTDHAMDRTSALSVINHLLGMLNTPDRYMLGAGMSELAIALPSEAKTAYRRNLARVIWCAMLDEAR